MFPDASARTLVWKNSLDARKIHPARVEASLSPCGPLQKNHARPNSLPWQELKRSRGVFLAHCAATVARRLHDEQPV